MKKKTKSLFFVIETRNYLFIYSVDSTSNLSGFSFFRCISFAFFFSLSSSFFFSFGRSQFDGQSLNTWLSLWVEIWR